MCWGKGRTPVSRTRGPDEPDLYLVDGGPPPASVLSASVVDSPAPSPHGPCGGSPCAPSPVWLVGDVDFATAPSVAAHLDRAVKQRVRSEHAAVVLDLSRVTFIDVAGLHLLLQVQECLEALGARLLLRDVPSCVDAALRFTGCEGAVTLIPGRRSREVSPSRRQRARPAPTSPGA